MSLASTYLTQSEHFHHGMLNEQLRSDLPAATERLARVREVVVAHRGSDEGGRRALALAARALRDEAFVLAYGDLFLAIGAALLVVLVLQATLRPISLAELRPRRRARFAHEVAS